jgi:hypothetical protein
MEVLVKPRRPPSLPVICGVFPAHSSFSVFRGAAMASFCVYFKELNCYANSFFQGGKKFLKE